MNQTGVSVDGSDSCSHKYGPIQQGNIVYPTNAERTWLHIIDQNKEENMIHATKFENDISELNKNESIALDELRSKIKDLRNKLYDRQNELETELTLAFEERRDKINENIELLNAHQLKIEELCELCDTYIYSDTKEAERKKVIVEGCKNITNTTPSLKYVETELRFSFAELDMISREIQKYGTLITQPNGSGLKCIFKSTANAANEILEKMNLDQMIRC
eukprot:426660_1